MASNPGLSKFFERMRELAESIKQQQNSGK
jgi:hypothetical protein